VNILAESRSEQALAFLEKVVHHRNPQIRLEVIKGLITIGGRRAAAALARLLTDREKDVQFTVLRALGMVQGAGVDESKALMEFLEQRGITNKQQENEITHEAVRTLGKIGGQSSIDFLRRYERIRWWRSRKPQVALREVAREAIDQIGKRMSNVGRTK
jgi:HEAT repeat protein